MTTELLIPNGTSGVLGSPSIGGGAGSIHAALSDTNDATYVDFDAGEAVLHLDLDTTPLGPGAIVKQIALFVRGKEDSGAPSTVDFQIAVQAGGAGGLEAITPVPGSTRYRLSDLETIALPPVAWPGLASSSDPGDYGQSYVDSLYVQIYGIAADVLRVMDVWALITWLERPVVTIAAMTTETVSNPTVSWVYSLPDVECGPQSQFQVKVFSAAEYGIGGFDPATSPFTYTSGVEYGTGSSHVVGPLLTATTYRAYVRAAETVNGYPHWSDWDFEEFDTAFTPPAIDSVVAVGDPDRGRMVIVVERLDAAPDWEFLTVERSDDMGATWSFVRGVTDAVAPAGDVWTGYDYEVPNGTLMLYRARARSTGPDLTGEWVVSYSGSWTSTADWLKAPATPSLNRVVIVNAQPSLRRDRRQGVHRVLGRRAPVVISDVRQTPSGTAVFVTLDDDTADDLLALLDVNVLLLQTPATDRFGSRFISPGDIPESRPSDNEGEPTRVWDVPFVEVDRPVDDGIEASEEFAPLTWAEAALFTWQELEEAYPTWDDVT